MRYIVAFFLSVDLVLVGDALAMRNPSSALGWFWGGLIYLGYLGALLVPLRYLVVMRRLNPQRPFLFWRDRRYPKGHCQSCGYNLTGNVSGRCPECGMVVEP